MGNKAILVLVSLLVWSIPSISFASTTGLSVIASPIAAPNPSDRWACTQSGISVSRTDGAPFADRDYFEVTSDQTGPISQGRFTLGMVFPDYETQLLPVNYVLEIKWCTYEIDDSIPEFLNVTIKLKNGIDVKETQQIQVPVIPWSEDVVTGNRILQECAGSGFPFTSKFKSNFAMEQKKFPRKVGGKAVLEGTFFRHGLASDFDELFLLENNPFDVRAPSKIIARTKTDGKGQFKLIFNSRKGFGEYNLVTYTLFSPARYKSLGPIPGPFSETRSFFLFDFFSNNRGQVFFGSDNWVPKQSSLCTKYVDSFNADMESNDENAQPFMNQRLYYFVKQSPTLGTKNLKSFSSYIQWDVKTGGRCYVNGYVTSSGKVVRGYYRRCP